MPEQEQPIETRRAPEIQLRPARKDKAESRWMRRLFLSAFPPEERPPFRMLRRRAKENVDWWRIEADGQLSGFFYAIRNRDLVYLFFFAIHETARGRGVGTAALKELLHLYAGKRVFLAIERLEPSAENLSERIKRKNFYLRCGLKELHKEVREGDVVYELLGVGGTVSNAEYQALMRTWLVWPFTWLVKMEILE